MSEFNTNIDPDFDSTSEQINVMPVVNNNEIRVQQFIAGFNSEFGVGKEFASLEELREAAIEYGKKRNVGRITLKCKHLCVYRAAKAISKRNKSGMIAITRSVGEHNHPLARDIRTYAAFRKMEPEHLSAAISMLKKHTPSAVFKVFYECS
ncbi:MAG: hypothetical protein EXX96DRAFT_560297 [Benjaminiella poitrasii]|nr:MAG: hypothetical protein EXX96DRAFT_560297 [Benjaminiella poitrasii]